MYDALGVLSTLFTSATAFNATGVDLGVGTPRRGLKARVIVPALSGSAAGAVFTPAIDESSDNTTFNRLSTGAPVTATTAAVGSEQFIPFETSKRYVRLGVDSSVTTGTPSLVIRADIGLSRPG